ncbi:alanyl-tRNA editing protein [Neobacillus sp. SM06]|uniref:alanyl-tRNA editing protein n=1 Tax=Neobacillus sp. SM06 TaxID=3422492 RepID=UPI003D29727E
MAVKLYYEDAYLQSFSTEVVKQAKDERGNDYLVLTQTAFYPTGGGQPHDTGTINGYNVIDVEEVNGEIRHYVDKAFAELPSEVSGKINWERRFDHMQQHAGQHILSAAFDQLFHYRTVSFHLGQEGLTIDIDTEYLTTEEAMKAEDLANKMILENRPIETKWVRPEELSAYPLRKETKVKENIRLVIIPDYDYNGCGGTHPKTTGEVRAIKILNWERQKQKIRVHFICGERVLHQFGKKQTALLDLTRLLNVPEQELPAAVQKLLDGNKETEKALEHAQEQLLAYEAKELQSESKPFAHSEVYLTRVFENRTIQELQKLARMIAAANDRANVFFAAENGDRLQVVFARGTAGTISMKNLLSEALGLINGKGGGNDTFAQGGGAASVSGKDLLNSVLRKYLME